MGFFLDKAHRVSLDQTCAEILFSVTKQLLQATLFFPLDFAYYCISNSGSLRPEFLLIYFSVNHISFY